jgi:hypothetical protein
VGSPRRGSRRPLHRSNGWTGERSTGRPVLERPPARATTRCAALPGASLTAGPGTDADAAHEAAVRPAVPVAERLGQQPGSGAVPGDAPGRGTRRRGVSGVR